MVLRGIEQRTVEKYPPCGSMRREMQPSSASNARRERHQSPLPWDPDLEEASEAPPYILLIDNWFPIHRRRRLRLSLTP